MALDAIAFDVDGTLIDTNAAHVEAWDRTLRAHGYQVSPDRIGVEVGKGGDKLIPSILGTEIDARDHKSLSAGHTEEFLKIAKSRRLPAFPGVVELLAELRRRGLRTVLATSSSKKDLQATQASAGVELGKLVDEVVTGDDAAESKPSPHIVAAAAKKLGLAPTQLAMVGDTPYDVDAARDAGVVCLGVTCGGYNDHAALRAAGAREAYRDPADLLARLDDALRLASPGSAHLTREMIESLMREALAEARQATEAGEACIGCVIARGDGQVVARGFNRLNQTQNRTAHAEMVAFADAAGKVPPGARDLVLVSTLEPCVMCLGAAMEAAVDTILYALPAPADGGTHRVRPPQSPESQMPRIVGNVLARESRALFEQWLRKAGGRNPQQDAFVRQLLDATV